MNAAHSRTFETDLIEFIYYCVQLLQSLYVIVINIIFHTYLCVSSFLYHIYTNFMICNARSVQIAFQKRYYSGKKLDNFDLVVFCIFSK